MSPNRGVLLVAAALSLPSAAFGAADCSDVKDKIRFMHDADQSIRILSYQTKDKRKVGALMQTVDRMNTARLKRIVDDCGWPTIGAVGEGAADAAWLIAQHADLDPVFQRRVVLLMEPLVASGEADPVNLAYLTDRTELAANRPQRYGTQFVMASDGSLTPRPCDDLVEVAKRRAAIGLPTLESYLIESRALMDRWSHPVRNPPSNAMKEENP